MVLHVSPLATFFLTLSTLWKEMGIGAKEGGFQTLFIYFLFIYLLID